MSNKIISLCFVSERTDKYTKFCRIADLDDGNFTPYTYSVDTDFYDTDRDLLYGPPTMLSEPGSIGVYEWSAYLNADNKWRTNVNKAEEYSWCEILHTNHGSIEELVQALKSGFSMPKYDRLHDHDLILCCRFVGNKCEAIYVSTTDAEYNSVGKLCLLDSVVALTRVTLDTRYAIGECKHRYLSNCRRKYLARKDACHVVGTVEVKTKDEVIGDIIKQSISKDALSRRDRQAARLALDKLSMPSIVEMIAARFQCSSNQAQKCAEEHITRTRERLDSTIAQRLIEMLIENDSESVQRMRTAVQKQWDETQQEQIEAAQKRQAAAAAAFEAIRKQIADAEVALQKAQERQAEAESKVEETLVLQEQIETEIQKRLEGFKADYASVLVENAIIASTTIPLQQSGAVNVASTRHEGWTVILPENSIHSGALEENIDVAVENWEEICANQDMARGLTLLSFAAYARKQPLLVVGEGAIPVSDIISSSICGQPAIKIHATGESQDYQIIIEEIEKKPKAVVCLTNGLKTGYEHLRTLMQMCPHRMFVVTEMHAESLAIEPTSLLTVFLPIFCDYFYTGGMIEELPTYDCSNELHTKASQIETRSIKQARAIVSQWLSDGFYPPVVRERCANLFAAMSLLAQPLGVNTNTVMALAIEFLFVPLLKCMRKEDALKTHLEENTVLDPDRKATLISFINSED
ncbi:MAG: hypothetical protein IK077_10545 [Thermoguttaceae bacterium]|nr:hypothetical protein [Thermoguttaceae bacterium]